MQQLLGLSLWKEGELCRYWKTLLLVFWLLGTIIDLLTWNPCRVEAAAKLPKHHKSLCVWNHSLCTSLWYGTKMRPSGLKCVGYRLLSCTERGENGRDYVQLKPTLCLEAGVTKSGQECSPRLSLRTKSAPSLYYVQWIINVTASMTKYATAR